jgi:metal-dependent HD superfamily phosphatase/phosphodiesterase
VHYQLVANIALKLCRLLRESGVEMSIVKNFNLTDNHAELVVLLASLLHDLGMSIHRAEHEEYSLFLTNNILREILSFLSVEEKTIIISETLHAIISHRSDGLPFTVEAGIVRVADALDMTEGRSRIPYEEGKIDIYSVSATAIDNIKIQKGQDEPISIKIFMNNSAGIFQVDQLFREKLQGSGLEKYIIVEAIIESEQEKKLLKKYTL